MRGCATSSGSKWPPSLDAAHAARDSGWPAPAAHNGVQQNCGADCDVTLSKCPVFSSFTAWDAVRRRFAKCHSIKYLAALHRTSAFLSVAPVNRRVAGSNPARGAKFLRKSQFLLSVISEL